MYAVFMNVNVASAGEGSRNALSIYYFKIFVLLEYIVSYMNIELREMKFEVAYGMAVWKYR